MVMHLEKIENSKDTEADGTVNRVDGGGHVMMSDERDGPINRRRHPRVCRDVASSCIGL